MGKSVFLFIGLALLCHHLSAQRIITGKIINENGIPLPNISVSARGDSLATMTKEDGIFSLKVPTKTKKLLISSVGFSPEEVAITKDSYVTIQLKIDEKMLQEVVVVGYGTQKKSELTSAVTKVRGEEVAAMPFSSVDQSLQGKVAGLQSITFSGQPGSWQRLLIRGQGSAYLSSDPLIVVDGVIMTNSGDISILTWTDNTLAQLNSNDIESISVLKDAAATAIYGSLGSNGVIIITTKRGNLGKTKINFTTEAGVNKHGKIPEMGKTLNSAEWLTVFKESLINAGRTQAQVDAIASVYGDGSVNTNWENELTRTGTQQDYNLSASGGDERTKFFVSGGYFKQEGGMKGADLKRIASNLTLDHTISRKINFSLKFLPSYSQENAPPESGGSSSPMRGIFFLRPLQNPYNNDGSLNINRTAKDFADSYNPLYILEHDIHSLKYLTLTSNIELKYNILKNFSFSSRMGVNYNSLEEYWYNNPIHGDGMGVNGMGFSYYERYLLYDWLNSLDYHTSFLKTKELHLIASAGYEALSSQAHFINAGAQNFPIPALTSSSTASTPIEGSSNGNDYSFIYSYARVNLNYKDKYFLQASFRRDGSSRFSEKYRFGRFPSIGAGWAASKEKFFSCFDFISNLKLRASYGIVGNANGLDNYGWRQTYGYGLNYDGMPGGGFTGVGNTDLKWESGKQINIGFDMSFLHNRINITADWYKRITDKLIFPYRLSLTTGFDDIVENIGAFENKGIEFALNATPVKTHEFNWELNFNISHNQNRVTKIPAVPEGFLIYGITIVKPGHDGNEFYLKKWAGVDPANGDPLWYTDSSMKSTTSSYFSAQPFATGKSASPKIYGGFSNIFTSRQFSLTADFYYNIGNYIFNNPSLNLTDEVSPQFNKYRSILDRWQKPGDVTDVPKLVYRSTNQSNARSTRFLYKADYIRLRQLLLSYTAKPELAKKMHLLAFSVYLRGTNLWTKNFDKDLPTDADNFRVNQNMFFYNKSITAGLNLNF
jgi:TonB-linked SusC/RagA family outer membrane protein